MKNQKKEKDPFRRDFSAKIHIMENVTKDLMNRIISMNTVRPTINLSSDTLRESAQEACAGDDFCSKAMPTVNSMPSAYVEYFSSGQVRVMSANQEVNSVGRGCRSVITRLVQRSSEPKFKPKLYNGQRKGGEETKEKVLPIE